MSKNAIIALAVTGGVIITGYFVYSYYKQKQAADAKQTSSTSTIDNIGTLLGDLKSSGGIGGIIGSIF